MRVVYLALAFNILAEASVLKETRRIAPALDPVSDKKFFKKDYPGDVRPKADTLHFHHPYPVVQDTNDFDKDFVKDENSDNGEWKAQTEYDRLRIKVSGLKKKAAEALAKKLEEEKEMKKTQMEYQQDMAKEKADIQKKKDEVVDPIHPEAPKQPEKPTPVTTTTSKPTPKVEAPEKEAGWTFSWPFSWPWSWPKTPEAPKTTTSTPAPTTTTTPKPQTTEAPLPTQEPIDTKAAAEAVEKAMKNFEECKKELAAAKEALKKLMAELEKAKMKQAEMHENTKEAMEKQAGAEKLEKELHAEYTKQAAEYAAAKAAYDKQNAKVDKIHADLKAAAAKVKAIRDAEDKDGGVYSTPKKSAARSTASQLFILAIAVAVGRQMA